VPHNSLTAFVCQFWLRAPLVIINNNPWIITYEWAAIVCECVKAKTKGQQQQFVDCVWSAVASNLSLGPKSIEVPLPGCRLRCLCTCADLTPKEITTQIETQTDTRPKTQIRRRATKAINWTLVSIWVVLPAELGWVSYRLDFCLSFLLRFKNFYSPCRLFVAWDPIQSK